MERQTQTIDWKDFFIMAKDTSDYNPNFEKKYKAILDSPHILEAIEKAKDYKAFSKFLRYFNQV